MFNTDVVTIGVCIALLCLLGWLITISFIFAQFMDVTFFTGT